MPKICAVNLSPVLPQRDPCPFTRVTVYCGKVNNQIIQRLVDTGSELTLIPGDLKDLFGPPGRIEVDRDQVVNGILAHSGIRWVQ